MALILFLSGIMLGSFAFWLTQKVRLNSFNQIASDIIKKAEQEAERLSNNAHLTAKHIHLDKQKELDEFWQTERRKIFREEERLKQREDKLEGRMNLVEKKLSEMEKKEVLIAQQKEKIEQEKLFISDLKATLKAELERASGLTWAEAKSSLLANIQNEIKSETANLIRKAKKEAEENADREATKIIATAIQRLASPTVSDFAVNTVFLPNEEMKGRIIGREGRNIRTLEKATGVNLLIDDTPGAVIISGFDPSRLQIAKLALSDLISNGRIHPTSIEEAVDKAKRDLQKQIKKAGEEAVQRVGLLNIAPEIIELLGKLKLRFSYGQNILEHSIEVAHLMGLMAGELGLDVQMAKRIGLLHDMGKAVSHEMEGTHAIIGHDLALKFGETKEVANGIGCHHFEMEPLTIEGSLCHSADAISASRPGARAEAIEEYIKRVKKLEDLAYDFPGIEKAYAIQAGRELQAIVLADMIDDEGLTILARDITKRIEQELSFPGKIKVTLIREKRIVAYAV